MSFNQIKYKFEKFKKKGVLQGKIPFNLDRQQYFDNFPYMRIPRRSLRKPICFVERIEDNIAYVKAFDIREGFIRFPVFYGDFPVKEIRDIKNPIVFSILSYGYLTLRTYFRSYLKFLSNVDYSPFNFYK